MVTLFRDHLRIEAVAVPEPGGSCCVTAEAYSGGKMVRGYYRQMAVAPHEYRTAELEVAEELARMSSEAE